MPGRAQNFMAEQRAAGRRILAAVRLSVLPSGGSARQTAGLGAVGQEAARGRRGGDPRGGGGLAGRPQQTGAGGAWARGDRLVAPVVTSEKGVCSSIFVALGGTSPRRLGTGRRVLGGHGAQRPASACLWVALLLSLLRLSHAEQRRPSPRCSPRAVPVAWKGSS